MSPVYTREEVRKHNNEKTLWMVIHNDVYDVTEFLNEHPGGADTLLDFAGKDSTVAFENVGHSDDARELMAKFKIGTVPPGEQSRHAMSCCKPKKEPREKEYDKTENKKTSTGCQVAREKEYDTTENKNTSTGCQVASCPGLQTSLSQQRSWRTFDGTPDRGRPNAMKSAYKPPGSPRVEPRVQTIVVPRETDRRHRGPPCERIQRPPPPSGRHRGPPCERIQRPPPPSGSQLKWVVLALGAAIVMGVVLKKYMT